MKCVVWPAAMAAVVGLTAFASIGAAEPTPLLARVLVLPAHEPGDARARATLDVLVRRHADWLTAPSATQGPALARLAAFELDVRVTATELTPTEVTVTVSLCVTQTNRMGGTFCRTDSAPAPLSMPARSSIEQATDAAVHAAFPEVEPFVGGRP